MQPLRPDDPRWIGPFRVLGRLGAGGMGRVFLARTPDQRQVAVKVVHDELAGDTGFRHRFRREVAAAMSVSGLFTARVLDADPDADQPWLATEFVAGPSLREKVQRGGPLPAAGLAALAGGLGEALGAIHAAGLVHRDLKPANVLLSPAGPKVIDFGIAWSAESTRLTATGEAVGTPEYMAPEQITGTGPAGPAVDVFALGAILAYAATARSPFAADSTAAVLYRVVQSEPDLGGVPAPSRALVAACLDKDPRRRPTAQQIAASVRTGGPLDVVDDRGTGPVTATPPDVARAGTGPRRGRGVLAFGAAALTLAGAVAAALVLTDPVGGPAVAPAAQPSAQPSTAAPTPTGPPIDPRSPPAVFMDRFCGSGDLVSSIAGSAVVPPPALDDPARARRDLLGALERSLAITESVLVDFSALRDDAPTPELRVALGQIVEEFTGAREAFTQARDTVRDAEELGVAEYALAADRFAAGTRNILFAGTVVDTLTLPEDYLRAAAVAPHCID
ncbi:serine/threonine-protein kinase [Pseudonocardia humida]|uniref:Protein kinase n=1 Tax=Pseudonocardia humida TaxID=2800819 RepID=A0ABT1A644_9PSEU|nr:serine/threonine-protein kinase [Pseudonocardia humida]MCO1658478.1 protein kinase [Pseudonocardia humida]